MTNDPLEQACPLKLDHTYAAYPDDEYDWYSISLTQTAPLRVLVRDYNATGELFVYDSEYNRLHNYELPNELGSDALQDLPPDTYYIRVYTAKNTTNISQTYHLTATTNIPPKAQEAYITPTRPRSDQELILDYAYYDVDGDHEKNTQIRWYKDGELQPDVNDMTLVSSGKTASGQQWSATIKPHDGYGFGALTQALTVTINTPPSFTGVRISPDSPPACENANLILTYYDPDGDPEGDPEIRWYRNGSLQDAYNNLLTLPSDATNIGEKWYARARPYDGLEYGSWQDSNDVTIAPCEPIDPAEPNNSRTYAYPLEFGQTYTEFYPGDTYDWYYVVLAQTAWLNVLVDNYAPNQGDLQSGRLYVYDSDLNQIGYDGYGELRMEISTQALPSGKYYILVKTLKDWTPMIAYHLTVTSQTKQRN